MVAGRRVTSRMTAQSPTETSKVLAASADLTYASTTVKYFVAEYTGVCVKDKSAVAEYTGALIVVK